MALRGIITILVILVIGYFIGSKWPNLFSRFLPSGA